MKTKDYLVFAVNPGYEGDYMHNLAVKNVNELLDNPKAVKLIEVKCVEKFSIETRKTLFSRSTVPCSRWFEYRAVIDITNADATQMNILAYVFRSYLLGRMHRRKSAGL